MKKSPSLKTGRKAQAFAPRVRCSVIMVNQALRALATLAAVPLLGGADGIHFVHKLLMLGCGLQEEVGVARANEWM